VLEWLSLSGALSGAAAATAVAFIVKRPEAIGRLPFGIAVGWYEGRRQLREARRRFLEEA
jgi:hypothetical protein